MIDGMDIYFHSLGWHDVWGNKYRTIFKLNIYNRAPDGIKNEKEMENFTLKWEI